MLLCRTVLWALLSFPLGAWGANIPNLVISEAAITTVPVSFFSQFRDMILTVSAGLRVPGRRRVKKICSSKEKESSCMDTRLSLRNWKTARGYMFVCCLWNAAVCVCVCVCLADFSMYIHYMRGFPLHGSSPPPPLPRMYMSMGTNLCFNLILLTLLLPAGFECGMIFFCPSAQGAARDIPHCF